MRCRRTSWWSMVEERHMGNFKAHRMTYHHLVLGNVIIIHSCISFCRSASRRFFSILILRSSTSFIIFIVFFLPVLNTSLSCVVQLPQTYSWQQSSIFHFALFPFPLPLYGHWWTVWHGFNLPCIWCIIINNGLPQKQQHITQRKALYLTSITTYHAEKSNIHTTL